MGNAIQYLGYRFPKIPVINIIVYLCMLCICTTNYLPWLLSDIILGDNSSPQRIRSSYAMICYKLISFFLGSLTSCIILVIFFFAPMMTSGYSLVGVTIVRFIVVKRPLTYKQDLTKPIMASAVVVMWIVGWATSIALNGTGGKKIY